MNWSSSRLLWGALLAVGACSGGSEEGCTEPGTACTWAGDGSERGFEGEGVHRLDAWFYFPEDLTFDAEGRAYVLDWNNHRVRRIELSGTINTVIGTDYEGDGPPEMEDLFPLGNAPGAPGTTVALNHPTDIEVMPDGRLVLAAWHNNKLRIYDPESDLVTVLAGNDYGFTGDGNFAYLAEFNQPKAVAVDDAGQIYTIDQRNLRVRVVTADGEPTISTMAGTGEYGNLGDGGLALDAQFAFDNSITPQPEGSLVLVGERLYVADTGNHRIRYITLADGKIDCIAGLPSVPGYFGDGGPALDAQFNRPTDIELGPDGRLYVADRKNNMIRAIDLQTGIIERVAGTGVMCDGRIPGDCDPAQEGGPALEFQLNEPYGIAFDPAGDLYIADTHNSRIVRVNL